MMHSLHAATALSLTLSLPRQQ